MGFIKRFVSAVVMFTLLTLVATIMSVLIYGQLLACFAKHAYHAVLPPSAPAIRQKKEQLL